ncbi:hypothetical protein [Cellulosimicrobium cellulans]|uniref:hypothetical protein n=1 Tax=Cellulosimicrobium cellulans TaxID=1710 RepID=UPI0016525BEF|nr:hypothetical protein [Cellulosimicrobium cellulans]
MAAVHDRGSGGACVLGVDLLGGVAWEAVILVEDVLDGVRLDVGGLGNCCDRGR